jgi:hypothetical protein
MIRKLTCVIALVLCFGLGTQRAIAADLFQWIDANGGLYFTDSLEWVPASIRNSAALIVRKNYFSSEPNRTSPAAPEGSSQDRSSSNGTSENTAPAALEAKPQAPIQVIDAPQQTEIVVVHANSRQPHTSHPCRGPNCRPPMRANFNDRQYIHPEAFSTAIRSPADRNKVKSK